MSEKCIFHVQLSIYHKTSGVVMGDIGIDPPSPEQTKTLTFYTLWLNNCHYITLK